MTNWMLEQSLQQPHHKVDQTSKAPPKEAPWPECFNHHTGPGFQAYFRL